MTLTNLYPRNTIPFPEIIYDETLLFSPHVFLLGLLFCDRAFAAYNLTSLEELSRLTIPPGRNELSLRLNRRLAVTIICNLSGIVMALILMLWEQLFGAFHSSALLSVLIVPIVSGVAL